MKEYMVGFLVLLALVGLGVAKENPHGDKHSSEAQYTDCSAYKGHQLRQCLQGRLVNTEEQKCDSAGNANCDCRGEGNACERSPGEDRSGEQHGHGGDDHGGHKGDNKGHHGKGNKGHGNRGDNGKGRGGDTSNKDDNDHKHNDGDKDREDNHNGSKGGRHNDDNDSHEGLRKHKGHHGSKEDRDGDDGGSHEGHEKHKGHHGSKEDRDGDDGGSHEGHEKHKGHHGSKEDRDGDDGGSHEVHEKHKGHHGSKEDRDGDNEGSHERHEKHKGHHGSKEDSGEDDGGSHEGHKKHKGHHGSKEDRDGDDGGSHEGHEKHKGHHDSKEDRDGDDGGSHEGHEKHKGHHGSKEDTGEDDGGSHEGHGNKGHPSSKEGSHEDRGKSVCNKLEPSQHGKWIPRQCSKKFQKLGHVCKLECNRGFDRSGGSQVRCMESGWEGKYGVNIIPTCMSGGTTSGDNEQSTESTTRSTVEEISVEFMNIFNYTDGGYEQVLFIVDSSQNVGETTFYRMELNFVKVITEVLFSRISFFGLTTYNGVTDVVIPLDEYQSSGFIQRVDNVRYSPRDGSDMVNALDQSFSDIRRSRRRTLVVLISGTESSTDGSGEARLIQTRGNILIPVIVGEANRNTAIAISSVNEEGSSLYFVFQSWESFSSTTVYISENYKRTSDDTSTTHPAGDETSDYRTTSDDMIHSTEDITSGTVEEISHEFLSILNNTGEGYEQVLFIVDSSQNVGENTFYRTELNFVKVITELLLSKITYFGLTTYNDIAVAVIPLAEYGSSGFIHRVDDVQYSPREGSDIANVLDRSFSDIQRTGRRTLVVLISGTESSTDGSGEARLIQSRGNIIIPVIVGEVNRNTATSISSTSEEGRSLYFLFKSWESFSSTIIYISESYETTSPGTTGTNPHTTEMISACAALEKIDNGHWESSTCSEESSTEGTVCHLVCESGFDLSGDAEVTCTESGWESSDGDNQLPACMTLEERSYELVERLNNSLHNTSNVLIVLDESWSVGQDHFTNVQLAFFNTLLNVISLSKHSIGVITYSDTANVVISLGEYEKSVFQDRMNFISYEQGGVSNIENALEVVTSEIQRSGLNGSTLILLVSTSNSSTDGSSQARRINNNGGVIFPLVVGSDYNRLLHISSVTEREERTFFKFTSWESFSSILSFINENYKSDSTEDFHVCEVLENSQRGHWEASNCSSGTSELGTVCEFVCEEGYELSGTPEVTCNQSGWVSYGGGRSMPSCKTIEEIGEDFIANINRTLGRPANLMFVVDGSGSLTEEQFDLETGLVNAIVRAFPLSQDRSAGVVTFSSDATVDVSVSSDDTCTFLSDVSAIKYPRGGTNIAQALQLANNELEQNAVHDFTITFLITDGISTTDPTEPAAVLKRGDNPLFAIGVGDYDAEQLTSIATYFYPIRDFGIFNSLKNVLETDYASRTNIQC